MGGKSAAGQLEIEVPKAAGEEVQPSALRSVKPVVEAVAESNEDILALVDVLYDIIATGIEPAGNVTCAQVESFLHEHAREPKSAEAFAEFFDRHGIDGRVQTQPRVPLQMLEPVPNMEAAVEPVGDVCIEDGLGLQGSTDTNQGPQDTQGAANAESRERHERIVSGFAPAMPHASENGDGQATPESQLTAAWLPRVAVALGIAVLLALWGAYFALNTMRAEAARAELAARQAQQRAAKQQAEMAESLRTNRQLIDHLERQNQLLLENLLPSPVSREPQ